jgi:hypothetical protein
MNAEKRKWLKRRSAENEWKFWTRICSMEGGDGNEKDKENIYTSSSGAAWHL